MKRGVLFGLVFLLLGSPLKAQILMGDPGEGRPWLWIDTTSAWQKKVDPSKPWLAQYKTPWLYEMWWWETARCQRMSTNRKQFKAMRFFFVNLPAFGNVRPFDPAFVGYTLPDSLAIFVALPLINDKALLMHEMTHALQMFNNEPPGHDERHFGHGGCNFLYEGVGKDPPPRRPIRPIEEDSVWRVFHSTNSTAGR